MLSKMNDHKLSLLTEGTKLSFQVIIDTIKSNQSFSKLILYKLNILKSQLTLQNQHQVNENIMSMLNHNFIEVISDVIPNHIDNEDLLLKLGEILFYIASFLLCKAKDSKESDNDKDKDQSVLIKNFVMFNIQHGGVRLIRNVIKLVPEDKVEVGKIYLKIFQVIIEAIISLGEPQCLEEQFIFIISLLEKYSKTNEPLVYLLEIIKKISAKEMTKSSQINISAFIQTLLNVITRTSYSKIATSGLQILDILLKTIDSRDLIRESKPISFIIKLLSQFKGDAVLTYHTCEVLSQILEKEDICGILKVLKIKSSKVGADCDMSGVLPEIREIVTQVGQNEAKFNSFKKNLTRILILMSKEKSLLLLLKGINSLDCCVGLLKSDLEIYSYAKNNPTQQEITKEEVAFIENLLPEFIKLVLSLLKTSEFDHDGEIFYCMFTSLYFFVEEKQIVYDILDFYANKDIKISEEFLKDFNQDEIDKTFTQLLRKYYNCKWLYSSLQKFTITSFWGQIIPTSVLFNEDCSNLLLELNMTSICDEAKKEKTISLMMSISIKLLFLPDISSALNVFNENSFHEFGNVVYRMIELIDLSGISKIHQLPKASSSSPKNESSYEIICHLITMIFASIENKTFGGNCIEDKCKLALEVIKKISIIDTNNTTTTTVCKIITYLTMRLTRIIDYRMENPMQILFKNEILCEFLLVILSDIEILKRIEDNFIKEILTILIRVLSGGLQISRFLRENGMIYILKICNTGGIFDYEVSKFLIQSIQLISFKHFKETAVIFKNFFIFRNFVLALKEIKFSKGINEKIYSELLVFLKNLVKTCEYYEVAEETNMIDHLVNEYNDIYIFSLDPKNRMLEVISEIFSMFSEEKHMLKNLLNSKLPLVMENILQQMMGMDMDKEFIAGEALENSFTGFSQISAYFSENLLEHFANIFISFFKSKEYSKLVYSTPSCKSCLGMIKNLICSHCHELSNFPKKLSLCELLIEYENSEVIKDKIMTPSYFRELSMKIPAYGSSTCSKTKEIIEKCLRLIENPFSDKMRKTINDTNTQLIKQLNELAKSEMPKSKDLSNSKSFDETTIQNNSNAASETDISKDLEENQIQSRKNKNNKKRSLINITSNPLLKAQFESIISNINSIIEIILDQSSGNIEQECEQLSDLLKMLRIFAKDGENIQMLYENDIIEKLILIMDNRNVLTFTQDQGYNLIGKMIESEDYINRFLDNSHACAFFLREMNKICRVYFPDNFEYIRNKVYIITKIMSKLSSERAFVENNRGEINIAIISHMLNTISCDSEIITNILIVFNNILLKQQSITDDIRKLIPEMIVHRLWRRYENEIRVLERIMDIIENLSYDATVINDMLELDLIENLNKILNVSSLSKIDSDGIHNILALIDCLITHRTVADKVIEQKTLTNIMNAATMNMFNTKIIEKCLSMFNKCARMDKNFITILGVYGVNDFCLTILTRYMVTCHSDIMKSSLDLMFILISDENNLRFFSIGSNMDIILKTFKLNMKNRDQVLLELMFVNMITTKEIELKRETNIDKITYDFTVLLEIINEVLFNYDEHLDIILQLCELITNVFTLSQEIWLKKFMMDVIVNNADRYIRKDNIAYIETFLQTISQMIKRDKTLLDIDCSSSVFYVNKIISGVKMNYNIIISILGILKHVSRSKNVNSSANLEEIVKILNFLESSREFHDDAVIITFSQILTYLCLNSSVYKEISIHFLIFLLSYLLSGPTDGKLHTKLLEDLKSISVYFHISQEDHAKTVAELLYQAFTMNLNDKNKKNLMNIFQIISSLCIQSEFMKKAFNSREINLSHELKKLVKNDCFDDALLDYQIKGCLLNLKSKKASSSTKLSNSSTIRSMSIVISQVEVKEDVKIFLTTERSVQLYRDTGEIKKIFISMTSNLEQIIGYSKGKSNSKEVTDEMGIKEMDSCVRSASTSAFSKSKGLFTKKPKPARCFSILGVKVLNKSQKTFNVECEKEEECIKYVDYISILINNYKSIKDDVHEVSPFTKSMLIDTPGLNK